MKEVFPSVESVREGRKEGVEERQEEEREEGGTKAEKDNVKWCRGLLGDSLVNMGVE